MIGQSKFQPILVIKQFLNACIHMELVTLVVYLLTIISKGI